MKRALITGISGQDGSYLAEHLADLGYKIYGVVRRAQDPLRWLEPIAEQVELLYGDLADTTSLEAAFLRAWPDEVYNLAGQVFVTNSWDCPVETFDLNVGALARLLKIIEQHKPDTRLYQAASSEMFGTCDELCNEETPLSPASPYGVSKLAAHRLVDVYRRRGIYVTSGILFNHESPRRDPAMVTRKITIAAARWALGDKSKLKLGNLQVRRDWGFAGDYVVAMHAMLQQPQPRDFVIGTGESHSVADFLVQVFQELNGFTGDKGLAELFAKFIEVDPRFMRPNEIYNLRADASRARRVLNWKPTLSFAGLVRMMLQADIKALSENQARSRSAEPVLA